MKLTGQGTGGGGTPPGGPHQCSAENGFFCPSPKHFCPEPPPQRARGTGVQGKRGALRGGGQDLLKSGGALSILGGASRWPYAVNSTKNSQLQRI